MPIPSKVGKFHKMRFPSLMKQVAQRGKPVQLCCNDLWHVKELENGLQYKVRLYKELIFRISSK